MPRFSYWLVDELLDMLDYAGILRKVRRSPEAAATRQRQDVPSLTLITLDGAPILLVAGSGRPEEDTATAHRAVAHHVATRGPTRPAPLDPGDSPTPAGYCRHCRHEAIPRP